MLAYELKRAFRKILQSYQDIEVSEIRRVFAEAAREWEIEKGWREDRKGTAWSDDELRIVLSDAPTRENCLRYAKAFHRGYGAIEQVYRWAATPDREIARKRPNDEFIAQIKRVSKQLGWRA